ncbi:MAG: EAL domain-containing protein [Haliea sp.]|uniref:putative bifunctional diguanylate cyclase/phosphodiesterase n=1 Tax=Haliea sp. TaxID=1932666 RepID=UPI0032EAAB63
MSRVPPSEELPEQHGQAEFLAALFEAMPDLYFMIDRDGTIRDFRGSQSAELYVPPEHFLGRRMGEVLPADVAARFTAAVARATASGELVTLEYQLPIRQSTPWYEARIVPIRDQRQLVCLVRNITELHDARLRLEAVAHYDSLTGLANRSMLDNLLERSIRTARRNRKRLAIMFIDLDRFKDVNDSLGHAAGDELLKQAARRLQTALRDSDILARMGGDEFVVVLDDLENTDDASAVACKLMDGICSPFHIQDTEILLSCSIGISIYPDDADTSSQLLGFADTAMYRAKQGGRNDWRFYTADMTEAAMEHMAMVDALREALDNDALTQVYHPQVDFVTGRPVGYEALARWTSPDSTSVPPSRFVSLAEQAGLARRLDVWSLRAACKQLRHWLDQGLAPGQVSINLSIHSLNGGNFPQDLAAALAEYRLQACMLQVEIKEIALLSSRPNAMERLRAIIDLGVGVAVDDFGAGFAALEFLRRLPVSTLKIDPAFMHHIPDDEERTNITNTVIAMGRALGLKVVAKGIESAAQADFIRGQGDIFGQGFYFSQPLSADQLGTLLGGETALAATT